VHRTPRVAVVHQVGQHFTCVEILDHSALGHLDVQVFARTAVKILALAVDPVVCTPVRVVTKGQERCHVAIRNQPNLATPATIATIGPTEGNGALATETDAAGSAIAGTYIQLAFVDKGTHDQ
jgi:hypothetical protein